MFKALNMFKAELNSVLEESGTSLPIPSVMKTSLCAQLGEQTCTPCGSTSEEVTSSEGSYTNLTIFHNGYSEIVKVTGCSNNEVTIERGKEGTVPRRFPIGACVQFIWTAGNMQCAIKTVMEGGVLSDSLTDCIQ